MIEAEVEGIGVLEFPDQTNPDVIQKTIKRIVAERAGSKIPFVPDKNEQGLSLPNQRKPNFFRTILDQGLQGATFGFADEITDTIGAGIASLATGQDYRPLRKEARDLTSTSQKRQIEERPITTIISNLGGGLLTGGAGATTKTGKSFGNFLRSGNAKTRAAKGALAGAASGTAFGTGTAEDGERLSGALTGAAIGGVTGGAISSVASATSGLNRALGPKPRLIGSNELKHQASRLYQVADERGGVIKANFSDKFVDEISNLTPQTSIGKTIAGEDNFSNIVNRLKNIRGQTISLRAAQEIDEVLGDAIDGEFGVQGLSKQGKKILEIQNIFRDGIEKLDSGSVLGGKGGFDALKQARQLWSQSRKISDIENIIQRSELTQNPANSIRSGFRALLSNKKRIKAYTPDERRALRKAAEGGVVSDVINTFGSRLLPIITAASGADLGTSVASGSASIASRGVASSLAAKRARDVMRITANNGRALDTRLIKSENLPNNILRKLRPLNRPAITTSSNGVVINNNRAF